MTESWEERQAKAEAAYALTPEDVERKLSESQVEYDGYTDEFSWHELDAKYLPYAVPGVGTVIVVHYVGGGEGGGEHVEKVIRLAFEDTYVVRYFKKTGFYASYDGTDWDGGIYEVRPREETVTVWEEVKK